MHKGNHVYAICVAVEVKEEDGPIEHLAAQPIDVGYAIRDRGCPQGCPDIGGGGQVAQTRIMEAAAVWLSIIDVDASDFAICVYADCDAGLKAPHLPVEVEGCAD